MGKKNRNKKNDLKENGRRFRLSPLVKGYLLSLFFFLAAAILSLSFFGLASGGGQAVFNSLIFLVGKAVFVLPLFLVLAGTVFFVGASSAARIWQLLFLALLSVSLGLASFLTSLGEAAASSLKGPGQGGLLGYFLSWPILKLFGFWVNFVAAAGLMVFGFFIFWSLAKKVLPAPQKTEELTAAKAPRILQKIFGTKLKTKEISGSQNESSFGRLGNNSQFAASQERSERQTLPNLKLKPVSYAYGVKTSVYKKPSLDLLETDKGEPITGDIRNNMAIIKKTLETFGIPVEMGEVNIGPTVTQYTLKPAEGIKLSRITTLANDLSLALAVHPLRIEAPIPGKPLVGIEVPNKARTQVRLKNLFAKPEFQNSMAPLLFSLGRDVAGNPAFADIARMPHLLVAGSTGSGKTICLNTIILGLIYRNSPEILRIILIDPKRVEFPVYQNIPHLLSPVIFDSQKTVNVLKWLVKEMERRFEVLAQARARDIGSYNRDILTRQAKAAAAGNGVKTAKQEEEELEIMPYIVVVIDELADLMAARGKEVEAGIVRLAQMARAVGIHLLVATQRPSVEVITGLIKANITSRITFQVASQVDSRTVIDMAGAEKLLGAGDLLYISSESSKPRRLQGAYVTDKEVKRVTDFLKEQKEEFGQLKENFLAEELERELEQMTLSALSEPGSEFFRSGEEDPLYLSAKQLVIEAKKASASLLQRRLRIGYARAARLLDILQERGVVGPADGARPREVYIHDEAEVEADTPSLEEKEPESKEDGDHWKKV